MLQNSWNSLSMNVYKLRLKLFLSFWIVFLAHCAVFWFLTKQHRSTRTISENPLIQVFFIENGVSMAATSSVLGNPDSQLTNTPLQALSNSPVRGKQASTAEQDVTSNDPPPAQAEISLGVAKSFIPAMPIPIQVLTNSGPSQPECPPRNRDSSQSNIDSNGCLLFQ